MIPVWGTPANEGMMEAPASKQEFEEILAAYVHPHFERHEFSAPLQHIQNSYTLPICE